MSDDKKVVKNVRELNVYRVAFTVAMDIFKRTKEFPVEERYSLTDQIRRSSRSVCSNLAEAWRKRKYRAAFISKITDCQQEASETQTWLEFSRECGYINDIVYADMNEKYEHILTMLSTMEKKAESFCD